MTRRAWDQVTRGGPSGAAVDRDGSVIAFKPLARDMLGALVSKPYLAAELEPMLRLGHEVLPAASPNSHQLPGSNPSPRSWRATPPMSAAATAAACA